jgi:hypothetical protein
MPYVTAVGADEAIGSPVALEMLERLDERTKILADGQRKAEERWRWQTIIGIGSAIFAAVRLGIIAVPTIREYRGRRLGSLGESRSNPARRRRRRTRRR